MRRPLAIGCGFLLLLAVLHPWLFELRGVIGAAEFEAHLHKGMTRDQVLRLRDQTGGSDSGYYLGGFDRTDYRSRKLQIWYTRWFTFCANGGYYYHIYFDSSNQLNSWSATRWMDGC